MTGWSRWATAGVERTTRRTVAELKAAWRAGHGRRYRPWIPEPGMWLQFDWGDGPRVEGRPTCLFCAWLAWSRYRVVIPCWDQTLGTLVACLDQTLRLIGGAPTYLLSDNAKTVTTDHVAASRSATPRWSRSAATTAARSRRVWPTTPRARAG
jgi:hypothetical protein